jgi:hypothetical protein
MAAASRSRRLCGQKSVWARQRCVPVEKPDIFPRSAQASLATLSRYDLALM